MISYLTHNPGGGALRNFWVGMCRWDPGTLEYGFPTKHDIQHAILDIINTIQCNMDQGKYSFGIFIDLKKRLLR